MTLIDRYLPRYQFHEHHSRPLAATPARAMAAVQATAPSRTRSFAARSPCANCRCARSTSPRAATPTRPPFGLDDFTLLERDGDRELAYGLIGRFWRAGYDLIPCADGPAFLACQDSGAARLVINFAIARSRTANCCPPKPACTGAARLVINFAIAPQPDGQLLSTETRVAPTAPACCASRRTGADTPGQRLDPPAHAGGDSAQARPQD